VQLVVGVVEGVGPRLPQSLAFGAEWPVDVGALAAAGGMPGAGLLYRLYGAEFGRAGRGCARAGFWLRRFVSTLCHVDGSL